MIIVLIKLYPVIPLSATLSVFQGHIRVKEFNRKFYVFDLYPFTPLSVTLIVFQGHIRIKEFNRKFYVFHPI